MQYFGRVNTSGVKLDDYICDLNLEISNDGYSCYPLSNDGFSYMWAGVKANYGIRSGKACYEVKITEYCDVLNKEVSDTHVVRVGWSTDTANLQLGEDKNSFGFGGTGKKSLNRKFLNYGRRFERGDVIGCYLAFENGWVDISYSVNGRFCGSAFKIRWMTDEALYPHILTKNSKLDVNFGQALHPHFSLQPGYKLFGHFPCDLLVPAVKPPTSQKECEIIMMVGLPGVGKSTWATNYAKLHPSKKYVVLGTDSIIDKMRIMGVPRKLNFGGRWEILIKQATECFNILLKKASGLARNLILDQTNVYATARRRKVNQYRDKGYAICAMVLVPRDEDMVDRSKQRTLEEGKEIPEEAVLNMKANFSLPEDEEGLFDNITFLELQRSAAQVLVEQYNLEAMKKGLRSNQQMGLGSNKNQTERKMGNNFYQATPKIQNSPIKRKDDYPRNNQSSNYQEYRPRQTRSDYNSGPPEKQSRTNVYYNTDNFSNNKVKQELPKPMQYQPNIKQEPQRDYLPTNHQPRFQSPYQQDRNVQRNYGNQDHYGNLPSQASSQFNSYSQPSTQNDEFYKKERKQSIEMFQSKWEGQETPGFPNSNEKWKQEQNLNEYDPVSNNAVRKPEQMYNRDPQTNFNHNDSYNRPSQDIQHNQSNTRNEIYNPQTNYNKPLPNNPMNMPSFNQPTNPQPQNFNNNQHNMMGNSSSFDQNQDFRMNIPQPNKPFLEPNLPPQNFNEQANFPSVPNINMPQFGNQYMPPTPNMPQNGGMPPNFNENQGYGGRDMNQMNQNPSSDPNFPRNNQQSFENSNFNTQGYNGQFQHQNAQNSNPNFPQSERNNFNNRNPGNSDNYEDNSGFMQQNIDQKHQSFDERRENFDNTRFPSKGQDGDNDSPRNSRGYSGGSGRHSEDKPRSRSPYRQRQRSPERKRSRRSLDRKSPRKSDDRSRDNRGGSRNVDNRGGDRNANSRSRGRSSDNRDGDRNADNRSRDRSSSNRGDDRSRDSRGGDRSSSNRGDDRSRDSRGAGRNMDNKGGDRSSNNISRDRGRDNRGGDRNVDNKGGDRKMDNRGLDRNEVNRSGDRNVDNRSGDRNVDNRSGDRNVGNRSGDRNNGRSNSRNNDRDGNVNYNRDNNRNNKRQNEGYDYDNGSRNEGYNQNNDRNNSRSNNRPPQGQRNDDFSENQGKDFSSFGKHSLEDPQKVVENWEMEQAGLNEQEREALSHLATVDFDQLKAGLVTLKKSQEMGQPIFEEGQAWNENQEYNDFNQGEIANMGSYNEGGFNPNLGLQPPMPRFPGMIRGRPRLRGVPRGIEPRGGLMRPIRPRMPLDLNQQEPVITKKALLDTPAPIVDPQEGDASIQDVMFPPMVRGPWPRMPPGFRGMGPPRMRFRGRFPPPGMRPMMRLRGRPMRPRMPSNQ